MTAMTRPRRQFNSSELSRNSSRVFAAAERSPITVTRRDGEALVLMSQRENDERKRLYELAADLIAVTTDDRGTLVERMAHQFPWMLALAEADRATCAKELVQAARASFATDEPHLALVEYVAWFETASALAAGLEKASDQWLDEDIPVTRP